MAKSERAFTLIELLIYVAIFAVVAGFFTSVLLITLRVQGTQTGVVNVSSELNFALQSIQRNIREATTISYPASGSSGDHLDLAGGPSGNVTVSLEACGAPAINNAICITVGAGAPTPLTTSKVVINSLKFTRYTTASNNPVTPGTETIQFTIDASNNTSNPAEKITRTLSGAASPLNQ